MAHLSDKRKRNHENSANYDDEGGDSMRMSAERKCRHEYSIEYDDVPSLSQLRCQLPRLREPQKKFSRYSLNSG